VSEDGPLNVTVVKDVQSLKKGTVLLPLPIAVMDAGNVNDDRQKQPLNTSSSIYSNVLGRVIESRFTQDPNAFLAITCKPEDGLCVTVLREVQLLNA
jgi:hypothetical protein